MTEAILSINEGEQIYKCLNSEWLVDANGPVMFRFVSKLRADGKIELVFSPSARTIGSMSYGTSLSH